MQKHTRLEVGQRPGMCCPVVPEDTYYQAFSLRGRQCMIQLLRHGENIAERRCLPCIRGGGTVLCTVTEGLQIPAAAQDETHQSLSQPDGCQLPLHKGAYVVRNRKRQRKACAFHLIRWAAGRARAETRLPVCVTSGNTSSGGQSPPPSPQGEGIAIRRCRIPFEAGLAPSGSPAAQISFHHMPFG